MKLECRIVAVVEDGGELSITLKGWADSDPVGTLERNMGTIIIPADVRRRRAYHIGRKLDIGMNARKE